MKSGGLPNHESGWFLDFRALVSQSLQLAAGGAWLEVL
jgi:hypothetical protein